MSILPYQRPMSKRYTSVIAVVYLALAGYMAYRGYVEHRNFLYALAAVLVVAAFARVLRARKVSAGPDTPAAPTSDKKVELFSKPKDF
jgi:hypothetical protein